MCANCFLFHILLLTIILLPARAQHYHENLNHHISACRRHGDGAFCSAGKTHSYVGPLDTAQQLKDALKGTAYKNEVIIFSETRLPDASQTISRIRGAAGYGHLLPVMPDQAHCHRLARIFTAFVHEQGPSSCGFYSDADERSLSHVQGFRYLRRTYGMTVWWRKWFTVARAVALGYNVMAIDADVLVLDDWYWRVKQPPMSGYNLLSQAECDICINGGFSYIQNANPAGPVAWIMYEAMHRAVRWSEDDSALRAMSARVSQEPSWGTCPDDQSILSDVLWNSILGEIHFASLWCMLAGDKEALQKLGYKDLADFMTGQMPDISSDVLDPEIPLTKELSEVACEGFREPLNCGRFGPNVTLRTAILQMPHSGGVWRREHGGYPFNPNVGPYTEAYRKAFQELGVPLPPNPEDPATEGLARNTSTELFGLLGVDNAKGVSGRCSGCWLESTWLATGRHGLWHLHLDPPPVQSVGHIHAGLYRGDFQKTVILQTSGHFDWRVAARVGGGPSRVFFANYPSHESLQHGLQDAVVEIQRVVAYAPGVITGKLDKPQFIHAVQGLAQVAVALGAVAAWPAAPCDAEWVLTPEARAAGGPPPRSRSLPWYHLNTQSVILPFGDSREGLQCEWTGFAVADCLMNLRRDGLDTGRGLLAVEFEHLRRRHPHLNISTPTPTPTPSSRSPRQPTPDTTLRLSDAAQPPPPGTWSEPQYEQLLRLNLDKVLQQLRQNDPVAIFWLDGLVGAVHGMTGVAEQIYGTWMQRCRALKYYDLPEGERSSW